LVVKGLTTKAQRVYLNFILDKAPFLWYNLHKGKRIKEKQQGRGGGRPLTTHQSRGRGGVRGRTGEGVGVISPGSAEK